MVARVVSRALEGVVAFEVGTSSPVTAGRSGRHDVLVSPLARVGLVAGGVVAGCGIVGAGLHWVNVRELGPSTGADFWLLGLVGSVAFGIGGAALAGTRPRLAVGWLLLMVGLSQGMALLGREWGIYALEARGGLPLGELSYWNGSWAWLPGNLALLLVLPLVLPDGRLPTRRWRPALGLAVAVIALESVAWAVAPYSLLDVELGVAGLENPLASPVASRLIAVSTPLLVLSLGAAIAAMVLRWRRATSDERAQLVWVLYGTGLTVSLLVLAQLFGRAGTSVTWLPALALVPLPAACVVAVLRHRLWNIDIVVSRSVLYGTLSAAVVGTYVATVGLLGGMAGRGTGAPVLATALVALLVLPLHRRLQRLVNQLVHGDAEDPYSALARMGRRLEAAAGPDEVTTRVLPEVVRDVARVLRAPGAAIEVRGGERFETGVSRRAMVGDVVAEVVELPLVYGQTEVGRLLISRSADALSRGERRLLADLARQAAVAVHGVLLAREVQQSRQRLVDTREEERRRLRRDLHDGLGPALAAVALQAETARDLVGSDPDQAVELLDRLVPRLNDAVADVRTVVHALRPPTLDDLGLEGALKELAVRFTTPGLAVRVETDGLVDLPAAVDVAAYRIVSEALANVARHAAATEVVVRVQREAKVLREASVLRVAIGDDGVGVRPGAPPGVGLRSMCERAEELGGTCTIASAPDGQGTLVEAVLPLVSR